MMLMQSTGQTTMQASQPVHMSSSSNASVFGSFFLAIRQAIVGAMRHALKQRRLAATCVIDHSMTSPQFQTLARAIIIPPPRETRDAPDSRHHSAPGSALERLGRALGAVAVCSA